MWSPEIERDWDRLSAEALAEVKAWRAAHPRATLGEIEREVDARLATARARLVEATALAAPAADPPADGGPPRCPACGEAMVAEGARTRRRVTARNAEVVLTRPYVRCSACGTGLFPPG